MAGITCTSAANAETAQTQTNSINTVQENFNKQINDIKCTNKSITTQKTVKKSIKYVKNEYSKQKKVLENRDQQKHDYDSAKTVSDSQHVTPNKNFIKQKKMLKAKKDSLKRTHNVIQNKSSVNNWYSAVIKDITQKKAKPSEITNKPVKTATNQNTVTKPINKNSVNTVSIQSTADKPMAAAGETKTKATTSNTTEKPKAPGSSSTVTSKSFTASQINDAAARVNTYIKTKHKLPNYVTIGTTQVQMPAFLKLLTTDIIQLNSGKTTPITLKNVKTPSKTVESVKSKNLKKSSYLGLAKRVNTFINDTGALPIHATSNLGKLNYKSLIYTFSKISAFYKANKRLPTYVSVKPWSTTGTTGTSTVKIPASLQKYVKATKNCQVTNSQIKSLAKSITRNKKTTLGKATAIFNWVRNKIDYSFYYNTRKGAVGTLKAKKGNCVDTSHLLISLERAAGIPARYVHGKTKFKSGKWYGHVWAGVYVNGKWYKADATSSKNSFGVIKNWTRATIKGKYASLPF